MFRLYTIIVFLISLALNSYYISMHAFLHDWDERFHALVAKNLAQDFLLPLLYSNSPIPVCDYSWACNTVWLHKQPLFLWQMALSIKWFGFSEWAVRFPSAVMLSLLAFPVYRMGAILFNKQTGIIAALLTVSNWFIIEHIDGAIGMDHNDVAFMFYVTLSAWALTEYMLKPSAKYVFLISFFAGCAMLNKLFVGLLAIQGLAIFAVVEYVKNRKNVLQHVFIATLLSLCVFLPWQIYCCFHFPKIFLYEWDFNQKHFWEVVEGHRAEIWFYVNRLKKDFNLLQSLIFIGMALAIFRNFKLRLTIPIIIMIISTYAFYTIAKTKIASYTMVVMPLMFLFMAFAVVSMVEFLKIIHIKFQWSYMLFIPTILFINFNYSQIKFDHSLTEDSWESRINFAKTQNTLSYKKIAALRLPSNTAVVGFQNFDQVECMFFTGLPSYGYSISAENIQQIKDGGYRIAVFENQIPPILAKDSSVLILPCSYQ